MSEVGWAVRCCCSPEHCPVRAVCNLGRQQDAGSLSFHCKQNFMMYLTSRSKLRLMPSG